MVNVSRDSVEALTTIDKFDYFRCIAIFVAFAFSVTNPKNWIRALTITCMVIALCDLLLPGCLLKNQVSGMLTTLQTVTSQLISCVVLAQCVCIWRVWRKSRDDTVINSLLWYQLLYITLSLISAFYYAAKFLDEHVYFFMFALGLAWLGTAYHVFASRNPISGTARNTPVTWLLRVDFIITLVIAVAHYCFPDVIVDVANLTAGPVSYFLLRNFGAVLFGAAMLSLRASVFRYDSDQNEVFISRILGILLMAAVIFYNHRVIVGSTRKEIVRTAIFIGHSLPSAIGIILATRASRHDSGPTENLHFTRSKGKVM